MVLVVSVAGEVDRGLSGDLSPVLEILVSLGQVGVEALGQNLIQTTTFLEEALEVQVSSLSAMQSCNVPDFGGLEHEGMGVRRLKSQGRAVRTASLHYSTL